MRLFDEGTRTDATPARNGEDSFSFLNRVASPFWERIRSELESWFAHYPTEHAADLRARFRSSDPRQHFAAWWELYLFRLFSCLGFEVEVHPDIPGAETHPDFRLSRGEECFYLEAATVFSGIVEEGRHGAREGWILDLVNEASNPNFFVGLDFEKVGMERPSRQEVIQPIEEWLATLDPDHVARELEAGAGPPELPMRFRDWALTIEAYPIKPEARGKPDHRLLGRGPMSAGYVNDVEMVYRSLRRKFGHYGPLDQPLAVAVLGMSSFLEREDVEQALFGRLAVQYHEGAAPGEARWVRQRNGAWMQPRGPSGTSVSAVLSASGLHPWTCARSLPLLWLNPWATEPLGVSLPFATGTAESTGAVTYSEAETTAAEVLGLPGEWPGPEARFE